MDWTGPFMEAIRDDPTDAIYIRAGFPSEPIIVIFENDFISAQGIGEIGVGTSVPMAICKTSDVLNAARGDTLKIDDTTYKIIEVRPDGAGITMLYLSKD